MVAMMEEAGIVVTELPTSSDLTLDAVYTRDAACLTPAGLVACSMAKLNRYAEPLALVEAAHLLKIPVVGQIAPPGKLEGGDVVWLSDTMCALGLSYRTNRSGADQFKEYLGNNIDTIEVCLPHYNGPAEILHLSSILSVVAKDLCLASIRWLPAAFVETLKDLKFSIIEIAEEESHCLAANALVVGERRVCMVAGSVRTAYYLEQAGVSVCTFAGDHLCLAGDGGPTCLTRPISFDPGTGNE
jgi:N-dimethylarginine dimethylaminohydrolase